MGKVRERFRRRDYRAMRRQCLRTPSFLAQAMRTAAVARQAAGLDSTRRAFVPRVVVDAYNDPGFARRRWLKERRRLRKAS